MARYYGTLAGAGHTRATRTGSKSTGLEATVQTFQGSLIVSVWEGAEGTDIWDLSINRDGSSHHGELIFLGTLQELYDKLSD